MSAKGDSNAGAEVGGESDGDHESGELVRGEPIAMAGGTIDRRDGRRLNEEFRISNEE
jgi:hypothetical protein